MSCLSCTKTHKLPTCSGTLILGQVEYINTDVYIFAKNVTTGRIHRQEASTSALGLVTMDLSDPSNDFYSPNFSFEIWVTLRDTNVSERLPVLVGNTEYTCFELEFQRIYGADSLPIALPAQYLLELSSTFTTVVPLLSFNSMDGVDFDYSIGTSTLVRQWGNKGTGNDAFQATNILQPSIVSAALNNQRIVDFTGNEWMDIEQKTANETSGTYLSFECCINPHVNQAWPWSIGNRDSVTPINSIFVGAFVNADVPDNQFGIEYYDGINFNSYASISDTVISLNTWNVIKAEFKDGDVRMWINGKAMVIGAYIEGEVITSLPDITGNHYLSSIKVNGNPVAFEAHIRALKIHTTEPSNEQKQLETLEMLAMI